MSEKSQNERDAERLNEAGGKLFELMSELILEELFDCKHVHAQPSPAVMHIKPDIFIGDEHNPKLVIFVTHATAKNAAGVKVDRNIEELFEIKTRFSGRPMAVNLIWHSPIGWSDGHLSRLDAMFDVNWVAFRDSNAYKKNIDQMSEIAGQLIGIEKSQCKTLVAKAGIHKAFVASINKAIDLGREKHVDVWQAERSFLPRRLLAGSAIKSRLKDDLMRCCLIPANALDSLFLGNEVSCSEKQFDSAVKAGGVLHAKSLAKSTYRMEPETRQRLQQAFSGSAAAFTETIRSVAASEGFSRISSTFESEKITASRIQRIANSMNESAMTDLIYQSFLKDDIHFTGRCWPIEICIAAIKARQDDDFGLTHLQRIALGDNKESYKWNSLTWFVNGDLKAVQRDEVKNIATVLCQKMKTVNCKDAASLCRDIQYWREMEIKKGKKSNPITWAIKCILDENGFAYVGFPNKAFSTPCPFLSSIDSGAITGVTRWHFLIENRAIIHVLSNYSTTHKDKEFASKSRLARYAYTKGKICASRLRVGLILDGEWSEGEVSLLLNAGVNVFSSDSPASWIKWIQDVVN
jgi:hypothetical protein